MSIELVTQPWVGIITEPKMNFDVLSRFVEDHGLSDLAATEGTPIQRVLEAAEFGDPGTPDLLSEFAGRFCYRSWDKGRSHAEYLGNVISERHGNVLAHSTVSFIVTGVSRALTHELIRHHVGTNPSQESQRYVTAEGGEIEVVGFKSMRAVVPPMFLHHHQQALSTLGESNWLTLFERSFSRSLDEYHEWLKKLRLAMPEGLSPTLKKKRANEAARCFLPNACETRLIFTMNMRAARNVLEQRGDVHADLEIRRLACAFARELQRVAPVTFADVEIYDADDGFEAVRVQHSKV